MMSSIDNHLFSKNLIEWYHRNRRDLPWRNTDDPYSIWVSEIMLQQTRVDTVIPYYHRFLGAFPTVFDLARADQQQVLKLWEGLGYYSRGRNLHYAAKHVAEKFNGKIPEEYDKIISLKGIGPYTAAAILSIAFQKKYAVVDGNVIRVIARYFGIEDDVRNNRTKNEVQQIADSLIPEDEPGDFNQAMMELGATVCKPQQPECDSCPLSVHCFAYNSAKTDKLPYKSKAKKVPHHQIAVGIIVNSDNKILIALRPEASMLGGLWEFPGGKKKKEETLRETVSRELKEELGVDVQVFEKFRELKHAYSHFKITLHAYWCKVTNGTPEPKSSQEIRWVDLQQIDQFPFPKANKTIISALKEITEQNMVEFTTK